MKKIRIILALMLVLASLMSVASCAAIKDMTSISPLNTGYPPLACKYSELAYPHADDIFSYNIKISINFS